MSLPNVSLLQETWKRVLDNLESCVDLIRAKKGYEDCRITVCVSIGDPLDTFTVPRGEWQQGIAGALSQFSLPRRERPTLTNVVTKSGEEKNSGPISCRDLIVSPVHRSAERSKSLKCNSTYLEVMEHMSMAEIKGFFSSVRDRLGLRAFVWLDEARKLFKTKSSDPITGARGRTNSRKTSLILMISICLEVDNVWREAIQAEMHSRTDPIRERKRSVDITKKIVGTFVRDLPPRGEVIDIGKGLSNSKKNVKLRSRKTAVYLRKFAEQRRPPRCRP